MKDSNPENDNPRTGLSALSASVLVLNRFYAPINVVSARRAFVLLYKQTAEAINAVDGNYSTYRIEEWIRYSTVRVQAPKDHEEFVRTPRFAVMVPRVIRLYECASLPKHEVKFTKRNVLVRDNHRCQYCGKKHAASKLTVDHIVPRTRGGRSSWTNVVTACNDCNTRKGGRLPWEVGMKLIRSPGVPRKNPVILDKVHQTRYRMWLSFVKDAAVEG
jgi:5-methylcytosine-specific restriction endonuclease McrA